MPPCKKGIDQNNEPRRDSGGFKQERGYRRLILSFSLRQHFPALYPALFHWIFWNVNFYIWFAAKFLMCE